MTDILPSWNDGAAKSAIVDFVARVTREGGPDYCSPAERIATFDNDGTLWCEYPMPVQAFFVIDRVQALVEKNASIKECEPFKTLLEHDMETLHALGKQGIVELMFAMHAGMTDDAFEHVVRDWLTRGAHPKFGCAFTQCIYEPQLELLEYLRANAFRTFIVSAGGIEFIRAFAEETYGVQREQVVGSGSKLRFELQDGRVVLVKVSGLDSFDDRDAKPVNIGLHIGRRPLLASGNSDGDLAMMRYATSGDGVRLALLIHHDDAEREFAYDREFRFSPLAEALERAEEFGITVVSMRQDWNTVFPPRGEERSRAIPR